MVLFVQIEQAREPENLPHNGKPTCQEVLPRGDASKGM